MTEDASELNVVNATIEFVRPGQTGFIWLSETVSELKRDDPFRRVTILAPSTHAARQARWAIARNGFIGVQTARLTSIASQIVSESGAGTGEFLNRVREDGALRLAAAEQPEFRGIDHTGLRQALLRLFRQARREEIDLTGESEMAPMSEPRAGTGHHGAGVSSSRTPVAAAAGAAYRRFRQVTAPFADYVTMLELATKQLSAADRILPALADFGCLVFLYPGRLGLAEARFLAAASRLVVVRIALASVAPDGSEIAAADGAWDRGANIGDAASVRAAERLSQALGRGVSSTRKPTAPRQPRAALRVCRAPDTAEEVLDVVRAVAADCHAGIPFHRVAILYRQAEVYSRPLRDALSAAGFPWIAAEGRSLAESRPGRCLTALLRVVAEDIDHEALIDWLETSPLLPAPIDKFDVARWRRVTRSVRVPRGRTEWPQHLRAYATGLERELARHPERDRPGTDSPSIVRAMAEFIEELGLASAPPVADRSWSGLVRWSLRLFERFVGGATRWGAEGAFAEDILRAIEDLAELDALSVPSGGVTSFIATLGEVLAERPRSLGAFGDGIFVGALRSVRGLAFDRVYILGLVEGSFPPGPPIDPFFPGATDGHPLDSRGRHREDERHAFLAALAAGDGGIVSLSSPTEYGGRAAFASVYLLECVASILGRLVSVAEFSRLSEDNHLWLRVTRSPVRAAAALEPGTGHSPAERLPAGLDDSRVVSVAAWHRRTGTLTGHALTMRADLSLARGLVARRSRWADALSEFDGNVAEHAAMSTRVSRRVDGVILASATSLETWATCPYRHFLKNVLGVAETRATADEWTIGALERGSLYHAILARYFGEALAEPDASTHAAILDRVIGDELDALELLGVTGARLAWEKVRRNAYTDLHGYVAQDALRRATSGRVPHHFEQNFGDLGKGDASAWPPLDLAVNGITLRFRGAIDRVDVSADGGSVGVYDYKTGRAQAYSAVATDPVDAGRHLQLALYSRVARRQFGAGVTVDSAYLCVDASTEYREFGLKETADVVDKRLDTVVQSIDRGIRDGAFPRVPGDDGWKSFENCQFCAYDRVCPVRRDVHWERKREDPANRHHMELTVPGPFSSLGEG